MAKRISTLLFHKFGRVYLALCCACCLEGSWPARVQPPRFGCSCPAIGMCSPAETVPKLSSFLLQHFYREESCRMKQYTFYQLVIVNAYLLFQASLLESLTLVDKLHDCCHLLPLALLGLGSPCLTTEQRKQCDMRMRCPSVLNLS